MTDGGDLAVECREPADRGPASDGRSGPSRRRFLGVLGSGVAAGLGVSGPASAQQTPVVSMHTNYFDPVGLYVEPGTTVRFEIAGGSHSATAYEARIPAGASPFDSGVISNGGFEHTFDTPGTYDYYCIPHRSMGMVGRIVVGDPAGPAEESPIPDGDVPDSDVIVEQRTVTIDEFEPARGDGAPMGPGMMGGGGPGWLMVLPVGFLAAVLGSVGWLAYRATRDRTAEDTGGDPAIEALRERYARGEISEEEFQRRRERLRE